MLQRGLKIWWLFLFFTMPVTILSQLFPLDIKTADSLEKFLPTAEGKERVDILNGISYALLRHYSNRSDSLATVALDLSEEINYQDGKAKALYCKGTNLYIQGDFINALNLLYEAADLYKSMADTAMLIDTYYQIAGVTFFSLTDPEEGVKLVNECLRYSIESKDRLREARMYSTLQYLHGGNEKLRLKYLNLYTLVNEDFEVARVEKAMVIAAYGNVYSLRGESEKALEKYRTTLSMINPHTIEERAYLAQLVNTIGDEFSVLGRLDSARYYYNYGMELARLYNHHYGSMINSYGLAKLYLKLNKWKSSLNYCDSVLFYGRKIETSGAFYANKEHSKLLGYSGELYIPMNKEYKRYLAWRIMSGAYQLLLNILETQENYKDAFRINKSHQSIQDSITGFQKRKEILELQYKYQAEQKDDQIMLLSQENQLQQLTINQNRLIMFTVVVIFVLSLAVLALYLRQNKIRSERKLAELKQKLFRLQMNPHFIFNSLTSVQNLILSQEDIKASIYLSRFSDLVRSILHNSQEEWITMEKEISTLENYLELQKIRFPEKFDYTIEVDEQLSPESIRILPMLVQPFVENAIEHGFKHSDIKGEIGIRFRKKDEAIVIEIEDNGIGRQKAVELKEQHNQGHQSMATVITRERIRAINKKQGRKIRFMIIDLLDDVGEASGTRVVFEITF
jgi:tetratricopeptide (TPR) repeat protein